MLASCIRTFNSERIIDFEKDFLFSWKPNGNRETEGRKEGGRETLESSRKQNAFLQKCNDLLVKEKSKNAPSNKLTSAGRTEK